MQQKESQCDQGNKTEKTGRPQRCRPSGKDCRDMSVSAAGEALQRGRGGCSALAHITQWEVQTLSAKKNIKTGFFFFPSERILSEQRVTRAEREEDSIWPWRKWGWKKKQTTTKVTSEGVARRLCSVTTPETLLCDASVCPTWCKQSQRAAESDVAFQHVQVWCTCCVTRYDPFHRWRDVILHRCAVQTGKVGFITPCRSDALDLCSSGRWASADEHALWCTSRIYCLSFNAS